MSGNDGLESTFQRKAIELIKSKGGYVLKTHISSFQSQGEPDLTVCYRGRYLAFELKVGKNVPSKLQLRKIREIQAAGGIAKAVWSLDEVEETLNEISGIQQGDEPERRT